MSTVKSQPRTLNGASQRTQNQRWQSSRQKGVKKWQDNYRRKLADKTIKKKSTQPNNESALTKLLKPIYRILRIDFLQHNIVCIAKFPGCTYNATQVHHRFKRTGWWLIMMDLFFPICAHCHKHATKHSKEAIEAGVSISRHSDIKLSFNKHTIEVMNKFGVTPPI